MVHGFFDRWGLALAYVAIIGATAAGIHAVDGESEHRTDAICAEAQRTNDAILAVIDAVILAYSPDRLDETVLDELRADLVAGPLAPIEC